MRPTSPLIVSTLALAVFGLGFAAARLPLGASPAWAAETAAPAPAAFAADAGDDTVVARVNGSPIKFSDISLADEEMGSQLAQLPEEMRFQYILSMLIDRRIVSLQAKAKKFQDDPDVKAREAYYNEKAMRDVYWVHLIKEKASEKAIRAYYDEKVGKMPDEMEAHAAHILVPTKAEADKAEAELKAGVKFDDVAKKYSKDSSAAEGGDLGWFKKGDVVPEFGEAAFKLKPGGVSAPVQTQFGWHVIRLEATRKAAKPSYEQAHDDMLRQLVREEGQKLIETLRKSAKIDIVGADGKPLPLAPASEAKPAAAQRPELAPAPVQ